MTDHLKQSCDPGWTATPRGSWSGWGATLIVALAIATLGACVPPESTPSGRSSPSGTTATNTAATTTASDATASAATAPTPTAPTPADTHGTRQPSPRAQVTAAGLTTPATPATPTPSPTGPSATGETETEAAAGPGTPVSGGSLGRVYALRRIRAGLHPGDRLRIVWEFAAETGMPLYEAGVEPDPESPRLVVQLHDVNAMQLETTLPLTLPDGSGPLAIEPIPDDALLRFAAPLAGRYAMAVQELNDPARLVIDLVPRR